MRAQLNQKNVERIVSLMKVWSDLFSMGGTGHMRVGRSGRTDFRGEATEHNWNETLGMSHSKRG